MFIKLLKIILVPCVPIYAFVLYLRNLLFDKKIFHICKMDAAIISAGNISVGGSGKTPLVIYLTCMLKDKGIKVGVLSRGYKRKSRGYVLVSNGKEIVSPVEKCGDEIYHTALECKVPAAVSENRCKGAQKLIQQTGVDVIVLDDAFQHRWIARDLDIVIFEQQFLFDKQDFNHWLLPAGFLREPFSALKRADAIIINRKFSDKKEIPSKLSKYFSGKLIFNSSYNALDFVDVRTNIHYNIDEFKGQKSLVVSGIANPESFITALEKLEINTDNKIIFGDHRDYSDEDIQKIRKMFYSTNSYSVITTEKDAVKLAKYSKELDDIDIYFLRIQLHIDEENVFNSFLEQKINKP